MKVKLSLLFSVLFLASFLVLNGCIEEAGENPEEISKINEEETVTKEPTTVEPAEEETAEEDVVMEDPVVIPMNADEVKKAFAEKYDKDVETISIEVTHELENHIRGIVKFGELIGDGGMFLAAKVEGKWVIVVDGQGAYTCNEVEPYNFPADMIEDCYTQ